MKTFVASVAVLLALAASVSGQSEGWCRCAAFISYNRVEMMVYEAPEAPIDNCDAVNQCKNRCVTEMDELSFGGDLWHVTNSGLTVGQEMCTTLADHYVFYISDHKVYGYFEVCGGAWQYADVASTSDLCCNGGQQKHCQSRVPKKQ
ncbi:uncharacterized protein LOC127006334 [Eriocheir sinensis]|uniref:uncharacterized protein LOC127006334 n=1 Tax=Eriocheir sinensis TaxID=95602 RepID=UPI0021C94A1B|nr:uncharacterized protein LOC127006334 [Eriocheir sinensis]